MEILRIFIILISSFVILPKRSECSYTVIKASNINEAAFTERTSNGLPETEFHECGVPERALQICDEVTSKNEFMRINRYKFVEGKPVEKKKRFHLRQRTKNGFKTTVLHLCKCPSEPAIYIQDNVYANDVTVYVDMSQISKQTESG